MKMLNELLNEYSNYLIYSEKRDANKTVNKYLKNIKECFEYMHTSNVDDIKEWTYIDLRENWLCTKRDEGLGNQSLNLRIVSIKSFLNYLKGKKIIKENVANEIKRFPVKQKEKCIDTRDIQAMIEETRLDFEENKNFLTMRNYFILSLAIGTGLRSDEMRSIKMNDINFTTGVFTTTGKYSKSREIKLNKELLSLYHDYLYYRNQINTEEDYLLVSKNGKHMYSANFLDVFRKYGKKIGLEKVHPHLFRHAFATILIEAGYPIEKVAKILGHSTSNVCYQFYYHPNTAEDMEIFDNNPFFNNKKNKNIEINNKVK
mgnify:CR=1 FL=1